MNRKLFLVIISILLVSILAFVLTSCGETSSSSTGNQQKSIASIFVEGESQIYVDDPDLSNYIIIVLYTDGTKEEVVLDKKFISEEDIDKLSTVGVQTIKVIFLDCTYMWTIYVNDGRGIKEDVSSISIIGDGEAYLDDFNINNYLINVEKENGESTLVVMSSEYLDPIEYTNLFSEGFHILTVSYFGVSCEWAINIELREFEDVKFDSLTTTYDGENKSIQVEGAPIGTNITYSTITTHKNVGIYQVSATISKYGYQSETLNATLTINKATYDMSGIIFEDVTKEWNGSKQEILISGILPEGVEVSYKNNSLINVGSIFATAEFTGDANNYENIQDKTATLTITKATVTGLTLENEVFSYDGNPHYLKVKGMMPAEFTVSYENNGQIEVGEYEVTAKFEGESDYYLLPADLTGVLTIAKDGKYRTVIFDDRVNKTTFIVENGSIIKEADYPEIPPIVGYLRIWDYYGSAIESDVTITTIDNPINYNITYYTSGYLNNTNNPNYYTIEYGTITLYAPYTSDGIAFDGWYTTSDYQDGTAVLSIPSRSTGDITLYAKYIPFGIESASGFDFDNVNYNYTTLIKTVDSSTSVINLTTSIVVSEGSTWLLFNDEECNNEINSESISLNYGHNNAYIKVYCNGSYKIYGLDVYRLGIRKYKFVVDGKDYLSTQSVDEQTIISAPVDNPSKDGYSFVGWSVNNDKDKLDVFPYTICADDINNEILRKDHDNIEYILIFYATFTAKTYTLLYDVNGGESLDETMVSIQYDELYTPKTASRVGYTFDGWLDSTNTLIDSAFTWKYLDSMTFRASWSLINYTISYDLDGGNATNVTSYNIETESFTLINPTKTGHTFTGWTGTDLATASFSVTIAKGSIGDRSYTANWDFETYTISYNLNGGDDVDNKVSYNITTEAFTLNNPTREYYVFAGWTGTDLATASFSVTIAKGSIGDRSYTANWTPVDYTISYDLDGGNATNVTSYNIETESFVLNNPMKAGYTFIGWTGSNGALAQTSVSITKGSTGNKSYVANWSIITYEITYNLNGGSVVTTNPTEYTVETATFALNNPTKVGYSFTGWTGTGLSTATPSITIAKGSIGDRSYTANWTPVDYTISYNLDGGSVETINPTIYTIESNDITLNNPTKLGYVFAGWTGSNGTTAQINVSITKGSTGNKSYTANWLIKTYEITYNLNGGSVATKNPIAYTVETATFTLNNPTREYYVFTGWTGSNGTTAQTSVSITKGSTEDKSYTANWTAIKYELAIDYNYGSVATANPTEYTVETATFTLNNPTRVGYTFDGWTGTGLSTATPSITIANGSTGDRSYKANWTMDNYSISYVLNKGIVSGTNPTEYTVETATFTLNNPTREGYTFDGWTGTGLSTATLSITIAKGSIGDRTYTANWTAISYNITFNLDGGSFSYTPSLTYTVADTYTLPTPTKEGSSFQGWSGDGIEGTQTSYTIPVGSTGSKTFTANWRVHTYEDGVCTGCGKYQSEGILYTLSSDGSYYIVAGQQTANAKASGDVYIAGTYEGKPVKEIGAQAFTDATNITSIHIPSTIVTIKKGAFSSSFYTLSSGVNYVDSWAVGYDGETASISLLSTTTGIAEQSFEDASQLSSVTLPSGIKYINDYAFGDVDTLSSINLPSTLVSLGAHVFDDCDSLKTISIPSNITAIPESAFYSCDNLTSVSLPSTLLSIGDYAFSNAGLKSITIPDSVTTIGTNAFYGCISLTYVSLPSGVTSISGQQFGDCMALTTILIKKGIQSIASNAFSSCNKIDKIYFKGTEAEWTAISGYNNSKFSNATIYYYQEAMPEVDFENDTFVGNYWKYNSSKSPEAWDYDAIANLLSYELIDDEYQVKGYATTTNLGSVLLIPRKYNGKLVTSIKESAFKSKTNITKIIFGDALTTINGYAFKECTGLTTLVFPDSLVSLKDYAFENCTSLQSVTFGDNVTDLSALAFNSTAIYTTYQEAYYLPTASNKYAYLATVIDNSLTSYTIHNDTTIIASKAFYGCSSMNTITIPNKVKAIGSESFMYCEAMATISLPNSIRIIGDEAFRYCTSLTSITIPSGTTSIGTYLLSNCTSLTSVTIPSTLECISSYAFYNCTKLTQITIPEGVKEIGKYAFYNCTLINRVDIPTSLTSIGNNAFEKCTGIFGVYITSLEDWVTITFGNTYSNPTMYSHKIFLNEVQIESLIIPDGVTAISDLAFYSCSTFTSISLSDTLLTIGTQAFYGCTNVTTIDFGNSLTTIGTEAFSACSGIETLTLPDSLITIDDKAFYQAYKITAVYSGNSLESIGSYAFYNCYLLYQISLPNTISSINSYAFKDCTALRKVYFGGTSSEWTYSSAFSSVTVYYYSEAEPSLNSSGTGYKGNYWKYDTSGEICEWADDFINHLFAYALNSDESSYTLTGFVSGRTSTMFTIPSEYNNLPVTAISEGAFLNDTSIELVVLPDTITSIEDNAFSGCTGLISVTIGSGVTKIGSSAFEGCSGLTNINYAGTQEEWAAITKETTWNTSSGITTITCSDGTITL